MTSARDNQSGFTLIEVLVVLVLVSIMAGAVALSLSPAGSTAGTGVAAQKFALDLENTVDEAMSEKQGLNVEWRQDAYRLSTSTSNDTDWVAPVGRVQIDADLVSPFVVSSAFAPTGESPLILRFCQRSACSHVSFDGFSITLTDSNEGGV